MAGLVATLGAPSSYRDRRYHVHLVTQGGLEQLERDLETSHTLYVGNLSFFTTEEQLHQVFSKAGEVKRIIMGLDRNKRTPCGFCFCEYFHRDDALDAMKYINGTKVDERIVRTDIDPGFMAGRQFGRGRSGGQVRDEWREEYDEGRGGWGARMQEDEMRQERQRDVYQSGSGVVPQGSSTEKRGNDYDDNETSGYRSKPSRHRERSSSPY